MTENSCGLGQRKESVTKGLVACSDREQLWTGKETVSGGLVACSDREQLWTGTSKGVIEWHAMI